MQYFLYKMDKISNLLLHFIKARVTDSLDPILFRDCVINDKFPFLCERFVKSFANNGESRNCALLFSIDKSVKVYFFIWWSFYVDFEKFDWTETSS